MNRSGRSRAAIPAALHPLTLSLVFVAACGNAERATNAGRRFVAAEDLRIGEAEGAPEVTFGQITGLASDARGRILVVDGLAHEVRVFHPDGRWAFTFGREGEGPGEMRRPCCPAIDSAGILWIRDGGNRRYIAFAVGDSSAEPRGQIRMTHGDINRIVPTTFDADGSLIDIGSVADSTGRGRVTTRFSRTADGGVARAVPVREPPAESLSMHLVDRRTARGLATFYFYQPHGPMHEVAHGPRGEWAQAVSSRYAVAWRAGDGSLLRLIEHDVSGPPLSDAERTRADSMLADDERAAGQSLPYGVPARKPPIRDLYFDEAGRLWVERSVPEGAPREADVWTRDGQLAFTLQWPANVVLREGWRGDRVALGVARDDLGVERVVRLRWE